MNWAIVGFGAIGQLLARLLQPFHVTLRVYDPYLPKEVLDAFDAKQTALEVLILNSEVIVLCAANTQEAHHLSDADLIQDMQKNAVLVNVGRSMLTDMKAI
jgi:D-3-phosphoglycerate dehydrogenase